jgi:hypothetical protein
VGDRLNVRLTETDEIAGSIVFEYAGREGAAAPPPRQQDRHERKFRGRRRR